MLARKRVLAAQIHERDAGAGYEVVPGSNPEARACDCRIALLAEESMHSQELSSMHQW